MFVFVQPLKYQKMRLKTNRDPVQVVNDFSVFNPKTDEWESTDNCFLDINGYKGEFVCYDCFTRLQNGEVPIEIVIYAKPIKEFVLNRDGDIAYGKLEWGKAGYNLPCLLNDSFFWC